MNVLFKVHNMLGSKLQEKYYQRAIEIEFQKQNILFEREKMIPLNYEENSIGRYFIDFVIEDKIALEVKAADYFKRGFTIQVLAYLNSGNFKLGIIANFNSNKVLFKRLINPEYDKKH
ncbi:GxxExxY protein [Candidatus Daviesbacteria bacterium]|nr:GxxExxY protein [Candidatus Daviesbacteria bacterium]